MKKFRELTNYLVQENQGEGGSSNDQESSSKGKEKKKAEVLIKRKNIRNPLNIIREVSKKKKVLQVNGMQQDQVKNCDNVQSLSPSDKKKEHAKINKGNNDGEATDDRPKNISSPKDASRKNKIKATVGQKSPSKIEVSEDNSVNNDTSSPSSTSPTSTSPSSTAPSSTSPTSTPSTSTSPTSTSSTPTPGSVIDNFAMPNLSGIISNGSVGALSDTFSSGVKYVTKGLKNMGKNIDTNNLGSIKGKISHVTKEYRREMLNKLAETNTESIFGDVIPALYNVMQLKRRSRSHHKKDDKSKKHGSSKKGGKKKKDRNVFIHMANLSVKDAKGKVSESVYNKLYMDNKFTTGCFTDSKGRPLWLKKGSDQYVDDSEDTSSDYTDPDCILDIISSYQQGKITITDPMSRVCKLSPDDDVQELAKNDHMFTAENVISNTIRNFKKLDGTISVSKSPDPKLKECEIHCNMPTLTIHNRVRFITYNRLNPNELLGSIKTINIQEPLYKFCQSKKNNYFN